MVATVAFQRRCPTVATVSGHRWVPRILHFTVATVARAGPPKVPNGGN